MPERCGTPEPSLKEQERAMENFPNIFSERRGYNSSIAFEVPERPYPLVLANSADTFEGQGISLLGNDILLNSI